MSNSAKNAKSIGLSVAGILVALPADADLASITWVERAIQNQTPIPAGSVITGYASGSYGSYLLAGSTVGGPYSGVSISDIGSQMSPYISGDAIPFGFAPTGATPTWLLGKGADESDAGGAWLNISNVANTIADKLSGSRITGYQDWATQYPNAWTYPGRTGILTPIDYILAAPTSGGPFASVPLRAALTGTGVINVLTNGIVTQNGSTLGSYIGGYGSYSNTETGYMHILAGGSYASLRTGAPAKWLHMGRIGSAIGGYGSYASDATGTSYMYVLAGGSLDVRQGSAAKWLDMRKMGDHIGGYSQNAEDETQTHVLAGDGGTGIPGWTSISTFGTAIGTVNGSQIKIEQTATAAELQAKTGTIYFPVVQDGKIYGVTLNDFYILMNAQF